MSGFITPHGARILRANAAPRLQYLARGAELDALAESVGRRLHTERRRSFSGPYYAGNDRPIGGGAYGMAATLFDKGRDGFNTKLLSWTGDTQKALLLDITSSGTWFKQVTGATNASPVVYTVTANGFSNNDVVVTGNIGGNLSANQSGLVTAQATNTIQLTTLEGQTVAGSGAYTSGGFAVNLTQATFVADVLGTREGTDPTIAGTTSSRGVANATSPITWTTVPAGNPATVIFYDAAGGSDASNRLVAWQDGRVRVVTVGNSAISATTMNIQPLRAELWDGTTGAAPVLWFSNGFSATLSAAAAQGADSLTVTALGHAIPDLSTSEVVVFGGGLYVTPSGGNIAFSVGTVYAPLLPTGLYKL